MLRRLTIICATVLCCLVGFASFGYTAVIKAADITGLRSSNNGGSVILLNFAAVNASNEDRTVVHFELSTLSGVVPRATLNIPVANLDPGGQDGNFDVYSFFGDGVVSTDEWDSGVLFQSFSGLQDVRETLLVDISRLVQASVNRNIPFLSFNFRGSVDRYFLGDSIGLPDTSITVGEVQTPVPAPSSALLFLSGLAAFVVWRRNDMKKTPF